VLYIVLLGLRGLSKLCLYEYEDGVYLVRDSPEPINKAATQMSALCYNNCISTHDFVSFTQFGIEMWGRGEER